MLWRNLVVAALLGAFGVCIGGIVRNQIVAIVGLLIFAFALEPALLDLALDVGRSARRSAPRAAIIGVNPVDDGRAALAAPSRCS